MRAISALRRRPRLNAVAVNLMCVLLTLGDAPWYESEPNAVVEIWFECPGQKRAARGDQRVTERHGEIPKKEQS